MQKISEEENQIIEIFKNNSYGKARQKILSCFLKGDYQTLECYLKAISYSQLEKLFQNEGDAIFGAALMFSSSKPLNFLAERLPAEISQFAVRKNDFEIVRDFMNTLGLIERFGVKNENERKVQHEIVEGFLKIDKQGVTELVFGHPDKIKHMTSHIRRDFENIVQKMYKNDLK